MRKTLLARLIKKYGLRCGAMTRKGTPCKRQPISLTTGNGKCRNHGGLSTGPKTAAGRARALANLKLGKGRKPKPK